MEMKWKYGTPKIGGECLITVCTKTHTGENNLEVGVAFFMDDRWLQCSVPMYWSSKVVAWMYYPKPAIYPIPLEESC